MSRYTRPLDDGYTLVMGYDRPLRSVFAHLVKDTPEGQHDHDNSPHCGACGVIDSIGFNETVATVSELMAGVVVMLTLHGLRLLTAEESAEIVQKLMDDGAQP
ncbi:hypothetical protein [Kitasatospora sp. NPDC085464]|uniref:hypothetical protein n=1 Tax=Kitasatospora sp. NPDC085464 TaxID=3364063 RepID=UPI0037C91A7D